MVVMADPVDTTISLKTPTVKKLKSLWTHGDDTYDIVVNRLLKKTGVK